MTSNDDTHARCDWPYKKELVLSKIDANERRIALFDGKLDKVLEETRINNGQVAALLQLKKTEVEILTEPKSNKKLRKDIWVAVITTLGAVVVALVSAIATFTK